MLKYFKETTAKHYVSLGDGSAMKGRRMRHNSFQHPPLKIVPSSEPGYLRLTSLARTSELCSQGSITPVINFILITLCVLIPFSASQLLIVFWVLTWFHLRIQLRQFFSLNNTCIFHYKLKHWPSGFIL